MRTAHPAWLVWLSLCVVGCSDGPESPPDAARIDGGTAPDVGSDEIDASALDASSLEDARSADDASSATDAPSTSPDAGSVSTFDPAVAGPRALEPRTTATVRRGTRNTPVSAWVPAGSDRLPLVVFLPGFQLTTTQYAGTLERLATHGFVVVGADPPASLFSASHVEMAADAGAVLDWALDTAGPLASRIDATRIAAMGHSLGGKLSTMLAFADARVGAILLLDPVNGGAGPSGYTASAPDIVPARVAPLAIPIGILGETNNATGGAFGMSCAPAAQNYTTFYDAAAAAPWLAEWTLTGADHMDFLDNPMCGFTCSACPDGPGDDAAQLAITRVLAVAFMRRHLLDDVSMDEWLLAARVPAGAVVRHRP